jgi:hypothetical protein
MFSKTLSAPHPTQSSPHPYYKLILILFSNINLGIHSSALSSPSLAREIEAYVAG